MILIGILIPVIVLVYYVLLPTVISSLGLPNSPVFYIIGQSLYICGFLTLYIGMGKNPREPLEAIENRPKIGD